ncbi:DUF2871 family protein [Clostridium folliculivorans]|uniref:DUF2871 domain-containing protein n=1 Tax=Clostridium folliculivorans TaxID=2886038 RepID=A0A9W5Y6Z4_9CLOT|nr:DUF2871 family protein [Clostridium folliculivorans]GKU27715.1 hypothetical protein CFOLD11_45420 [Clostridium folliculivorans]GKU32475.1 hypothetical protein CFB3_45830 [Clostridium folliculivorans]
MKQLKLFSIGYAVLWLLSGLLNILGLSDFNNGDFLKLINGHLLILGTGFMTLIYVADNVLDISKKKSFNLWLILYNASLMVSVLLMLAQKVMENRGFTMEAMNLSIDIVHLGLGVCLLWVVYLVRDVSRQHSLIKTEKVKNK